MVATKPLDLAKQGNADAIAALLNQSLKSKGINIIGKVSNGCLTLVAESQEAPDKTFLKEFISKGLHSLKPASINRVVIQGKVTGKVHPVWRENIDLSSSQSRSVNKQAKETSDKQNFGLNKFSGIREIINTALLGGIFLALLANLLKPGTTQSQFWEYTVEGVDDEAFLETMLEMGAKGWDLSFARRAVSGEGYSSEGLYEVIFQRQIGPSQARSNLRNLDLLTREHEAESFLSLVQSNQRLHYLNEKELLSEFERFEQLLAEDLESYETAINRESANLVIVTAIPTRSKISSFIGATAIVDDSVQTIICKSSQATRQAPDIPQVVDDLLQCSGDSYEP
jgi:hypothetical protein